MALSRRRRCFNAVDVLRRRSCEAVDAGTVSRNNIKLLRGLLLQDTRTFSKVWCKASKSTITCEAGQMYFENYLHCYSCLHLEPSLLYKLPRRTRQEKFEDALLCQTPLDKTLETPMDQKPNLLVLTANNWLCRLSAHSGKELERIYLSPNHKFRYLGWDVSQEVLYVKSIQKKESVLERQAGITQNTLMHLAIFKVFPLQIVGIIEISKNVFGSGVSDVVMSQGVLAVSYSNKSVKLYSSEQIFQRYTTDKLTLGKQSSLLGGKNVGQFPYGIPVNVHITDSIPVIFEVSCSNSGIQIGYPWHFIHTPPHKNHSGTYHICSIQDCTPARNGIRNMKCCSLETDMIMFHPDDSGRIIHVGPKSIEVLKIVSDIKSCEPSKIVEDFSLIIDEHRNQVPQVTVTSSGRTVKQRYNQLDDDPNQETFRMVEYEDELDILAVVVTNGAEGGAQIRLYDNQNGQLLRTIAITESWDETYRHELVFDKDTIIHIEQQKNTFCCHVYKLDTAIK
ncbi:DDB1- and CUL4-associated factor 17 isoform X2 [Eucyclogobius newberryi]|uniref:DDB1- and CUL4-associated factor 17 isoform X2 n=1 Tax=Eucyclogobius newberryi TaxID=166745 RepID=UPI003B598F40